MLKYHIQTIDVGSDSPSTVLFSAIPQTYDDLILTFSTRSTLSENAGYVMLDFNQDTSNTTQRHLHGGGSSAAAYTYTNQAFFYVAGANLTSNTFSNGSIYIPNYTLTGNKTANIDTVTENNSTAAVQNLTTHLWSGNAALTSIRLVMANSALTRTGSFSQHSSFSLYGIKRGALGVSSAYGGTITTSGGYTYHTFTASSTLNVPRLIPSAEMLIIAGGGAGGSYDSGGGGAGGLCYHPGFVISPGSYQIVIGSGGSGATTPAAITAANNSVAFGVIAFGGGYGGSYSTFPPQVGGSGGGGQATGGASAPGAAATQTSNGGATGYGNAGGAGEPAGQFRGGGGGGAGEAGNTDGQGYGGDGLNTWSAWATATSTGVGGFYAGGGAGGSEQFSGSIPGGDGGGGASYGYYSSGDNGAANTGSGGAGAGWPPGERRGGNGGSGLVIIRYLTPTT